MDTLITVTGPSGSGKTSLIDYMVKIKNHPDDFGRAITCTTRKPRIKEVRDVDYHFISKIKFMEEVKAGNFIEWTTYDDNLYGCRHRDINLIDKEYVLYNCDLVGSLKIRQNHAGPLIQVFITASQSILEARLNNRACTREEIVSNLARIDKDQIIFDPSLMRDKGLQFDLVIHSRQGNVDHIVLLDYLGLPH